MDRKEVIAAGNAFALTAVVVFAFVYFAIVEPQYARSQQRPSPEQLLNTAIARVDAAQSEIQARLERRTLRITSPAINKKHSSFPLSSESATGVILRREEVDSALLQEKLAQLSISQQSLAKAKAEEPQYAIPFVGFSMGRLTLLKFFPFLVVIGFFRLLLYRAQALRTIGRASRECPVWAAPVSFMQTGCSFAHLLLVNTLGLGAAFAIILLMFKFILQYYVENKARLLVVRSDCVLMLILVIAYLALIGSTIIRDLFRPDQQPTLWIN
jgi:preprotein translocase subunit YajC